MTFAFKRLIFCVLLLSSGYISAERCLVFGGRGWIGQKLIEIIRDLGDEAVCAKSRLENRYDLEAEIREVNPDYIINSAGKIGVPNVNWCETNKEETIRANVLGLVNLVDVAYLIGKEIGKENGIHVTNIATGCIYSYDDAHPMGSGIGFTEDEEPNFSGSFYSKTKIIAEKLFASYPNALNLRVRMPISNDLIERSFIGKIIRYKKLINVPNSMTILEDLLPLVPQMIKRGLVGIYNFVNPGTISHNQIMDLYKKYINPNHQYENFTVEEQNELLKVPRSNSELSASKLLKEFPGIPNIQDSIIHVFECIARNLKENL